MAKFFKQQLLLQGCFTSVFGSHSYPCGSLLPYIMLLYIIRILLLHILFYVVASSVTNTTVTLISPNVTSELYNITVTCTIHPDSTADQCVVMVMDDGRVTRNGNESRLNLQMR